MAWLSTFQTMRIKARLAEKQKALSALDKALSEINEVKEYQLDGGDGTVRTMYRGAGEIRKQISILENEIEALYRKLSGAGVISMQLRRKR